MIRHITISAIIATVLTGLSYVIGLYFHFITSVSWLEAFSVWTSFSCTYLCVVQSRWNYPIGLISITALCLLFQQQGLYASMALQVYLVGELIYGWFRWGPDETTRPVRWLDYNGFTLGYLIIAIAAYFGSYYINNYFGGTSSGWDTAIFVASIVAQLMMDNKRMENWIIWLIVDVISVVLYWNTDLKVLSIQMGLFGLNAVWAWFVWKSTMPQALSSMPKGK